MKVEKMATSERVSQAFQARVALDSRFASMRSASTALAKPRGGWIHAIRTAMGMPVKDLAKRLAVAPSTVLRLESSEVAGTIQLNSLAKIADELGCELVYALVPRQEISLSVKRRATEVATQKLRRTQQTMALERQAVADDILNKLIERKAEELVNSTKLWGDEVDSVD